MNVVFISPHFPLYFHNFCSRLKNRGVNVLGIGDAQYSEISNETKESLSEYYRVNSLENYDEVYEIFSSCSGAAMYNKAILEKIGLFDVNFGA